VTGLATRGTPRPVVVAMSTLAALQVLTAGSALADVVPFRVAALLALMVAAAQAGVQFYVQSLVTPWQDVIAAVAPDGTAVAGPAHPAPTGSPVPEPITGEAGHSEVGYLLVLLGLGLILLVLL
jgi:hypothetical protein